jgi:Ankyrin repeats (many copies)
VLRSNRASLLLFPCQGRAGGSGREFFGRTVPRKVVPNCLSFWLHNLSSPKREVVVKQLLEKGADPESKGGWGGWTPLWRAAANGHEAVVKLLTSIT